MACVNINQSWSAAMWAKERGHNEIAKLLRKNVRKAQASAMHCSSLLYYALLNSAQLYK